MKVLIIRNLRLVVDAFQDDPIEEAKDMLKQVNLALEKFGGDPVLSSDSLDPQIDAVYENDGEETSLWEVNVMFQPEASMTVVGALDTIAAKHKGEAGIMGHGHQSWVFPTEEQAYAFGYEAYQQPLVRGVDTPYEAVEEQ